MDRQSGEKRPGRERSGAERSPRERSGETPLRLALPKGRMYDGVAALLGEAGIRILAGARAYRPVVSLPAVEAKILKPQNVVEMLHHGSRDLGFTGADWVREIGADLVELADTGLDPVRLVAAAPADLLVDGRLPSRRLLVASEYPSLASAWVESAGIDAELVHARGATEVFPPEDADCIVDNTATGATLRANGLEVVEVLMDSSTRLYASRSAMEDATRAERIERFVMLVRSVLEARGRALLEVNVSRERLESVIAILPCMREATVAPLHGDGAYAVRAAVPREALTSLIPKIKERGGTDVVVTRPAQIVP